MAELWFYHLERSELERALPPLLEKCLQRGWRALVRCGSSARVDALNASLWTFRDDSFVPHAKDGEPALERQPVVLTTSAANPNGAKALFLVDGAALGEIAAFERACLMFDGRDEAALNQARQRWKEAKAAGLDASYWKEDANGRWERQS
ncbi:DNA polymerase III chi subunit [alpha proteobacterium U9-1i]|nr:DNA polymerase III chi subunit [alpha proteobacterium U9-1i]